MQEEDSFLPFLEIANSSQRGEYENNFLRLLEVSGVDIELISHMPLHYLLYIEEVNPQVKRMLDNGMFWKLWVEKNIFPRHTDAFIESIPGKMKWRYYARLYGRWETSELYIALKEGDVARFFPYMTIEGVTVVKSHDNTLYFIVDGQLAMDLKSTGSSESNPLLYAPDAPNERIADFETIYSGQANSHILLVMES